MRLFAMRGFSARHERCLPESSAVGTNVSALVLLCEVEFIRIPPFHHSITAGGRDPDARHSSVTDLPAESGCCSPSIQTDRGRTIKQNKTHDCNNYCSDIMVMVYQRRSILSAAYPLRNNAYATAGGHYLLCGSLLYKSINNNLHTGHLSLL